MKNKQNKQKYIDYRQGDVMLRRVGNKPQNAQIVPRDNIGRVVLLDGEITGHAHVIESSGADLYEEDQERYLDVSESSLLVHEDHDTHIIEPGIYQQIIQVEEGEDEEIRRVVD